jgi:thiol-disulfide isomerase/thioredoxin
MNDSDNFYLMQPAYLLHRLTFNILLSGILLLLSACQPTSDWELVLQDAEDGHQYTFDADQLTDRLLVINYWAEWCKPCMEEMPELNRFAQQQADRVEVVGVNFDRKQGEALLQASQQLGIHFPLLNTDPATVFTLPDISVLPTTILIDREGNVVTVLLGPQTLDSLKAAIPSP